MVKGMSHRMMTFPRRGDRGFTLVELLITVVIIAILTAIAVPSYITVVSNSQDSAAKQELSSVAIAQDLGYADAAFSDGPVNYLTKAQLASEKLVVLDGGVDVAVGDDCWVASSMAENANIFYATSDGTVKTDGKTFPDTSWCVHAALLNNLSPNPLAVAAKGGYSSNNGAVHEGAWETGVVGHPEGITTARMSTLKAGVSSTQVLSMYNVDALGNTTTVRNWGVWVKVNASGYRTSSLGGMKIVDLPVNQWTWVQSPGKQAGWASVAIGKADGSPSIPGTHQAWTTGARAWTN